MGFAIYQHESAAGIRVSSTPEPPSHLPPHPIPLGYPGAPALGALLHALNLHWSSVYVSLLFSQVIPLSPSFAELKSVFCTSLSPLLPCM